MENAKLTIDPVFLAFIEDEVLPGTGIDSNTFGVVLRALVRDHSGRNAQLLDERKRLQASIDAWHASDHSLVETREYLREIGYLAPVPTKFTITTNDIDVEITTCAPQLVVPIDNARYATNAANARWGSLFDALYGTDALTPEPVKDFNLAHCEKVFAFVDMFLDGAVPLASGSHADVSSYRVLGKDLVITIGSDAVVELVRPEQFVGFTETSVLFLHNGLHIELVNSRDTPVGNAHHAGIGDVVLEAAVSTILDLEDAIAAVDAEDKVAAYRVWNRLQRGDIVAKFDKDGRGIKRILAPRREYQTREGESLSLPGRGLLLVRNVGLHMYTDCVRFGSESIPEGLLDLLVTVTCAIHDRRTELNSRHGSIYIIKPKLHGPAEVRFVVETMQHIEELLGLPACTIKLGIMDEERRTTVNLRACIWEARDRIFFINTGFLDRVGDEIHTMMHQGPVASKSAIKEHPFLDAYEASNVAVGIECGFIGRAQIGKGMWAFPKLMKKMLGRKFEHLSKGASTSWVPSPTAATLHALNYHAINVRIRQESLLRLPDDILDLILAPPLMLPLEDADTIQKELASGAQSILGYVVRWVQSGIGCSLVPDLDGVGLMEDRATVRISSQQLHNWLLHGLILTENVLDAFVTAARIVDKINTSDLSYVKMCPAPQDTLAFKAAIELVFANRDSGYTETVLHAYRKKWKAGERCSQETKQINISQVSS